MSEQELIKIICEKEIQYGFYNYKIDGISIYSVIRNMVRSEYLIRQGFFQTVSQHKYSKKKAFLSCMKSCWDLICIFCTKKRCGTVFIPWVRYDKIDGIYLEKYSDSFIELSDLNGDKEDIIHVLDFTQRKLHILNLFKL